MLLNGVISLALGIMIWRQWPESSLWVIGIFVGIDMLFNGWSLIMLALTLRSCRGRRPDWPVAPAVFSAPNRSAASACNVVSPP